MGHQVGGFLRWQILRRGLINSGSGSKVPPQRNHIVRGKQDTPTNSSFGDSGSVRFQATFSAGPTAYEDYRGPVVISLPVSRVVLVF